LRSPTSPTKTPHKFTIPPQVAYFSEKISPALHDKAMIKEAFASWKEYFIQDSIDEKIHQERFKLKDELIVEHNAEVERQKALFLTKVRGGHEVRQIQEFRGILLEF
jgi:hypothetical protein